MSQNGHSAVDARGQTGGDGSQGEGQASATPLLTSQFTTTSTGSMELVGLRQRKLTTVSEFESQYRQPEDRRTAAAALKEGVRKRWRKLSWKKVVMSNLPIVRTLQSYRPSKDLPSDVVAGLTAGIMMIPQGMAFASLSTLQPIVGLYISFFSSLTYFLLGTGQQTSFGCIAILSIMMGSILDRYEKRLLASSSPPSCSPSSSPSPSTTTLSTLLLNQSSSSYFSTLNYSESGAGFNTTTTIAGVTPEDVDLEAQKLALAGGVTLLCGLIFVFLGKAGLGKVTVVLSDSLVTGVTVGAAFHVGSSQLKTIFGLGFLPRYSGLFKLLKLWFNIAINIHRSNLACILASFLCILIIYLVKRFVNEKYKKRLRVPVPIEVVVMIVATIITYYADLDARFDLGIIKEVPTGVPAPSVPDLANGVDYLTDGLIIIIVAFIQTLSVAKLMGLKHNYRVDANQEMFAIGVVNVVCSLFSGYISGASVSRTVVQDSAGGRSQVASLVAALLVLLVILFMGPYFYFVPKVTLAAIIVVSLRSLMLKLLTIPDVWRKSRVDCVIFVSTALAVVVLDADIGLLVGVVVSIILVLVMTARASVDVTAHIAEGGDDTNAGFWRSRDKYFGGQEVPEVKVVRVNTPMYFVNTEVITDAIFKKSGFNPLKVKKKKEVEVDANNVKPNSNSVGKVDRDIERDALTAKDAERDVLTDADNTAPSNGRDRTDRERERAALTDSVHVSTSTRTTPSPNGALAVDVERGGGTGSNGRTEPQPPVTAPPAWPAIDCDSSSGSVADCGFSTLVLDLSGVSFMDLMGVKALEFLITKYGAVGVTVYVTGVTERCLQALTSAGFMGKHGGLVMLSLDAVLALLAEGRRQDQCDDL